MVAFVLFFIVMMARAIIGAYTLTPTSTAEDLRNLPLWQIPLVYIWDYAQHGWVCLGFAFTVSGLREKKQKSKNMKLELLLPFKLNINLNEGGFDHGKD
jgi:hypothetical protein